MSKKRKKTFFTDDIIVCLEIATLEPHIWDGPGIRKQYNKGKFDLNSDYFDGFVFTLTEEDYDRLEQTIRDEKFWLYNRDFGYIGTVPEYINFFKKKNLPVSFEDCNFFKSYKDIELYMAIKDKEEKLKKEK